MLPTTGGGGGGSRAEHPPGGTPADLPFVGPAVGGAGMGLSAWAAANVALLVALAVVATGVVVALIVTSFIAKGGMAQATTDLATGAPRVGDHVPVSATSPVANPGRASSSRSGWMMRMRSARSWPGVA